jgi:hypothetical protein
MMKLSNNEVNKMSIPEYSPARFADSVPPLTVDSFRSKSSTDIDGKVACFTSLLREFKEIESGSSRLHLLEHRSDYQESNRVLSDLFKSFREELIKSEKPLYGDEDLQAYVSEIKDQITGQKNSLEDLLRREGESR